MTKRIRRKENKKMYFYCQIKLHIAYAYLLRNNFILILLTTSHITYIHTYIHTMHAATLLKHLNKQRNVRQLFTATSTAAKSLTAEKLNPRVLEAQYAVRGELVLKSMQYAKELENGSSNLPFKSIIACNIGNPQEVGQSPISFPRQVLALCTCPELLQIPSVVDNLPVDVVERAQRYLKEIPSGTGAYSQSKGVEVVRDEIAAFIEERDGHPAQPEHIFVTDGASPAVQMSLQAMIAHENVGIMIPIPQYPLYSAAIAMNGGKAVSYFLDESADWGLHISELQRSLDEATANGTECRAVAVINPGNPTGQVMPYDEMKGVVQFCHDNGLVLLADEVYQENIWMKDRTFNSFKKVVRDMEASGDISVGETELLSFHSVSKGFYGECGRRGGYVEFVNIDEDALDQMYKLASVNLCSNLDGQLTVGLMVQPPKEGQPSYTQYMEEKTGIMESLQRRADRIVNALNTLEGVTCNTTQGSLYAFPQIQLPQGAVDRANELGKPPDTYYCLQLLDATGIVVVPGSGFGQVNGTWHFRTTILPQEEDFDDVIDRMTTFHTEFMKNHQ